MNLPYPAHTKCLISNSENIIPLKGYEKHYLVKSIPVGFVFCSRIPTDEEMKAYYSAYPRESACSPVTRERYAELLKKFGPWRRTNKILDVGCGDGYFLEEAKKKGWEVYVTEYSTAAVEICNTVN